MTWSCVVKERGEPTPECQTVCSPTAAGVDSERRNHRTAEQEPR